MHSSSSGANAEEAFVHPRLWNKEEGEEGPRSIDFLLGQGQDDDEDEDDDDGHWMGRKRGKDAIVLATTWVLPPPRILERWLSWGRHC